jgi:hypothetical protein
MAWTTVKGKRYYRTSYRENGVVKNRYFGRSRVSQMRSELDQVMRTERTVNSRIERAWEASYLDDVKEVRQIDSVLSCLVVIVAREYGFRMHHRQWRRNLQQASNADNFATSEEHAVLNNFLEKTEVKKRQPLGTPSFAGFPVEDQRLLKAASEGDRVALSQVKKYIEKPECIAIWGDPAHAALCWLIGEIAGDNDVIRESTHAKIRSMQKEFGYAEASAFKKLAITRIIHNWLHVSVLEVRVMQQSPTSPNRERIERQVTLAEKRLMQCLKTLAFLSNISIEAITRSLSTSTVDE